MTVLLDITPETNKVWVINCQVSFISNITIRYYYSWRKNERLIEFIKLLYGTSKIRTPSSAVRKIRNPLVLLYPGYKKHGIFFCAENSVIFIFEEYEEVSLENILGVKWEILVSRELFPILFRVPVQSE